MLLLMTFMAATSWAIEPPGTIGNPGGNAIGYTTNAVVNAALDNHRLLEGRCTLREEDLGLGFMRPCSGVVLDFIDSSGRTVTSAQTAVDGKFSVRIAPIDDKKKKSAPPLYKIRPRKTDRWKIDPSSERAFPPGEGIDIVLVPVPGAGDTK